MDNKSTLNKQICEREEKYRMRAANKSTAKQKVFSIVKAIIIGVILGLAAKLVDNPNINPIFDNLGGRLGIWVFVVCAAFFPRKRNCFLGVMRGGISCLCLCYVVCTRERIVF
ncbi:hypothetical protein [Paenibacillus sp. IHBB 3054]|uniref:hypothetical protein n=1 Tax=Paenibacillus sp. IHBB 3054 TaxID=3425689 RepID=UPI003F6746DD